MAMERRMFGAAEPFLGRPQRFTGRSYDSNIVEEEEERRNSRYM
jgi:hypothetical protein